MIGVHTLHDMILHIPSQCAVYINHDMVGVHKYILQETLTFNKFNFYIPFFLIKRKKNIPSYDRRTGWD